MWVDSPGQPRNAGAREGRTMRTVLREKTDGALQWGGRLVNKRKGRTGKNSHRPSSSFANYCGRSRGGENEVFSAEYQGGGEKRKNIFIHLQRG